MIDHISIGVRDLTASRTFYEAVLAPLGMAIMIERAATVGFGKRYPEFWINARPAMAAVEEACGTHICLRAPSREAVHAFHEAALAAAGARRRGAGSAPGLRQGLLCGVHSRSRRAPRRAGNLPDGSLMPEDLHVLELRPNCECCDRDLPPDAPDARIWSFECTFCAECAETVLGGICPNCGGELVRRPVRPAEKLAKYPPASERTLKPDGCPREDAA